MIQAAIKKRCSSIGFSEHSYVPFDPKFSMTIETTHEYIKEVTELKGKYKGEIDVFLGIEQDYYTHSCWLPDGLDYVIGTVHHVEANGHITVDAASEAIVMAVEQHFGGDYYALAEAYFATIADVVEITKADIIGHFDLVAKYNIDGALFDEEHPRYTKAALGAMDKILASCKIFEVNTGAMFRMQKKLPYPSVRLLKELCKRGGEVVLSSDSHSMESLCFKFDEMTELLKTCGFKHIKRLTDEGFIEVPL